MPVEARRRLPSNPTPATRLFLRRLERAGVDSVQKLSASHWETINALEAGPRAPLIVNGEVRS